MTDAWMLTSAPVLAIVANVISQAMLSHVWQRQRPSLAIGCGAILGLVVAAGIAASVSAFPQAKAVSWSVLSYIALAFGYWAFLNLNLTSVRIRMLKEISTTPERSLPLASLAGIYDDRELIERRLARLEAMGQVVRQGNRFVMRASSLLWIARLIRILRRAIIPRTPGTGT